MATRSLGQLTIDLIAKIGGFTQGMTQAERIADQKGRAIASKQKALAKEVADAWKGIAGLLGGALSVAAFTGLVKGAIDAGDHLNDLSKKSGVAVETLGGIGFAATQAGGSLEGVTDAFVKLDKSIASALGGNQEAIADFKDLGISLDDLKTQTPDQIFAKLADAFAGAEAGALDTAQATRVLGKAGADQLALLKDGGDALLANIEYYKRYSGVTKETAEASDQFNDTIGKIKLLSGAFGQQLATSLLPTLQNLADLWLENKEKGDGFKSAADAITEGLKGIVVVAAGVATAVYGVAKAIGGLAAAAEQVRQLNFSGALEIGKETFADIGKLKDDYSKFYDTIYAGQKKTESPASPAKGPTRRARAPGDTAAANEATKALKDELSDQIKLIRDFAKSQADAFQLGNSYLETAYQDAELSQRQFFDQQKNIRDEALQAQLEAIDKEIAAQRAFANNAAAKPEDRKNAEREITLLVQQRAEAVTKASGVEIKAAQDNAIAVQKLRDAYKDLQAAVLEGQGNAAGDAAAAAIRNAQQIKQARDLITQAGGDPAVADQLARQLANRTEAARIQKEYNNLLDETQRREQEIYLDAANGGKSELDVLAAIRDARKEAIGLLQEQARAAAALAQISGSDEDKKRAADLALQVKKAQSEIDPLAQRINKSLEESLSAPLAEFIKGTKSASEAFKDFAANILSEVANLAAKDIAREIFGSSNGQGGIGAAVSGIFGGNASSGGGLFSQLASFFGGFFADGGSPPMGKFSVVGENGPELFVPKTAGTIVPNNQIKVGQTNQRTQNNYITIAPPKGMSRDSAMQVGADISRQLSVASRRNN